MRLRRVWNNHEKAVLALCEDAFWPLLKPDPLDYN